MSSLVKDPMNIRLGMIGMTEGNGHPYSWSAIYNNYNKERMTAECPFPGIPAYLNKVPSDEIGIPGAKVTHVYCDQKSDAEHVSALSLVPNVVNRPEEMLGEVDAVIIGTDIGSQHVRRARFFIENGVPLLIDKPLCDNRADLEQFIAWDKAGAKFISASSMRFGKEFKPYHQNYHELGEMRYITMTMPKKWETYGIHALETIYPIVGPGFVSVENIDPQPGKNLVHLVHSCGADVLIANRKDIFWSRLMLVGNAGEAEIKFQDSYNSFRDLQCAFVEYLRTGVRPIPFEETVELMTLVIAGIESGKEGGKRIAIN